MNNAKAEAEHKVDKALRSAMRKRGHNPDEWCNIRYTTALAMEYYKDGKDTHFECRSPSGHDDDTHWCPAQDDIEEQMLYLKQSLGINVPEEGITA